MFLLTFLYITHLFYIIKHLYLNVFIYSKSFTL